MSEPTPPTLAQTNTLLGGEPQGITYDGVTGTGKTMLALRLAAQFPGCDTPDGTVIPVFYVETPSPVTVKSMASCLLAALGDPEPLSRHTTSS